MKMAPTYELYTYFRSSCSARVRIAALLKNIPLEYHFIHLVKGEQLSTSYAEINPNQTVPTLIVNLENGEKVSITQSVAILEYLEEVFTESTPLLPPVAEPTARARVRELMNIIACDLQPVTNLRILQRIKGFSASSEEWAKTFMTQGLRAYEKIVAGSEGRYSVGDTVTLADVVLSPAVDGALRFGVDLKEMPNVERIYKGLQELEAFQKGGWRSQPDTPDELRRA